MEDDERALMTGILSKGASFRLFVSGKIGPKEIETLIKKLEIDKDILASLDDKGATPETMRLPGSHANCGEIWDVNIARLESCDEKP